MLDPLAALAGGALKLLGGAVNQRIGGTAVNAPGPGDQVYVGQAFPNKVFNAALSAPLPGVNFVTGTVLKKLAVLNWVTLPRMISEAVVVRIYPPSKRIIEANKYNQPLPIYAFPPKKP